MGFNYVETQRNRRLLVGNTLGMDTIVSVEHAIRPSAVREEALTTGKGKLYHFTVSYTAGNRRSMDYLRILQETEDLHGLVSHLILDSFQRTLTVSLPAVGEADAIIDVAERFHRACAERFTYSYHDVIEKRPKASGEDFTVDPGREYDLYNQPFEHLAKGWPH